MTAIEMTKERLDELRQRYSQPSPPQCRLCGSAMALSEVGGGRAVWHCDGEAGRWMGMPPGPERVAKKGHYSASEYVRTRFGDDLVIALVDAYEFGQRCNRVDAPLLVAVENDELVIRIGVGTLARAARHCPAITCDGGEAVVEDRYELAKDVRRELTEEDEDGTTPVHGMLDAAILAAWENGSTAFAEDESGGAA